jgi:hypothetical protein
LTGFWIASLVVAVLAFLACRRWPRFALFVSPLSVVFPWALASSEGSHGARFPAIQDEAILGACALVLIANLVGMQLGGFKFVFFTLHPGQRDSAKKSHDDRRA